MAKLRQFKVVQRTPTQKSFYCEDLGMYLRYPKSILDALEVGETNMFPTELSASGKYLVLAQPHYRAPIDDTCLSSEPNSEAFPDNDRFHDFGDVDPFEETVTAEAKIPQIPKGVFIDHNKWSVINTALNIKRIPLILGPKGVGKSTVCKAVASAMGADYYYFDLGQAQKPKKFFVGGLILDKDGSTSHVTSEFYKAFKGSPDKPTLIFLDEITRIPPQASNYLMTILDWQAYIYNEDTGERVYKGENVKFIAAGNNGWEYTGTEMLDAAFSDRFTKVVLEFLDRSNEKELILSRTKIPNSEAFALARVGDTLRQAYKSGSLSVPISHRQILDAAAYVEAGFTIEQVVNDVILTNYILTDEVEVAKSVVQSL